jgi:hypothetical protein
VITFETISERLAGYLRQGDPIGLAAVSCGVPDETVKAWIERGKREPNSAYGRWVASFDGHEEVERKFMEEFMAKYPPELLEETLAELEAEEEASREL